MGKDVDERGGREKGEGDEKEEKDDKEEENWRRKTGGQGRPAGVLNFKQNSILPLTNHITSRLGPNLIIVMRVAIWNVEADEEAKILDFPP